VPAVLEDQLLTAYGLGFLTGVLVPLLVEKVCRTDWGKFFSLPEMKVWNVEEKKERKENARLKLVLPPAIGLFLVPGVGAHSHVGREWGVELEKWRGENLKEVILVRGRKNKLKSVLHWNVQVNTKMKLSKIILLKMKRKSLMPLVVMQSTWPLQGQP